MLVAPLSQSNKISNRNVKNVPDTGHCHRVWGAEGREGKTAPISNQPLVWEKLPLSATNHWYAQYVSSMKRGFCSLFAGRNTQDLEQCLPCMMCPAFIYSIRKKSCK